MGRFLEALKADSRAKTIEMTRDGFVLAGEGEAFDQLAREALEGAGEDYVALPTGNGAGGYERVVIVLM